MFRKTHMLGGAIAGYIAYPSLTGLISGLLIGAIADIDEPKGSVGKKFKFISIPLNRIVGHRTMTHSLLFSGVLFCVAYFIGSLINMGLPIISSTLHFSLAVLYANLSHIILDMLSGRVAIFWPSKRKYGIKMSLNIYYKVNSIAYGMIIPLFCITIIHCLYFHFDITNYINLFESFRLKLIHLQPS